MTWSNLLGLVSCVGAIALCAHADNTLACILVTVVGLKWLHAVGRPS